MRILLYILFLSILGLSQISAAAQSSYNEKELQISLRLIGHKLLLIAGDSNSRVLPIEKDSSTYRLRFNTNFPLHPDELIDLVDSVMKLRSFVEAYVVEIEKCEPKEIVYSYAVSGQDESNLISCKGRALPSDCYAVLFTLKKTLEFHKEPEIQSKKSATEEGADPKAFLLLTISSIIVALILLYFKHKRNRKKGQELISLGKFQFDKRKAELILSKQKIELSTKESDLLLLLYTSVNETLERDFILNQVWGDEGDYVGRTLDVFISKLRKKLEADPEIKIVNVRGVGYRLVLS